MIAYAVLKPNGCIDFAGISRNPPPGYVPLPGDLTPEYQLWLMHVNGEWVERPELPYWTPTSTGIRIDACPDGVMVEVHDLDTGAFLGSIESGDGLLVLDLPDAGTYRISVSAPDPWVAPEPFALEIDA